MEWIDIKRFKLKLNMHNEWIPTEHGLKLIFAKESERKRGVEFLLVFGDKKIIFSKSFALIYIQLICDVK